MITTTIVFLALLAQVFALNCADGYRCHKDPSTKNLVWVMREGGNVHGPTCSQVCQASLMMNKDQFYVCNPGIRDPTSLESFQSVAKGLGFECQKGRCWGGLSRSGQTWVSVNEKNGKRECYIPDPSKKTKVSCNDQPGNANCFGDRFSLVCPCWTKPLDEACLWNSPPNNAKVATWPPNDKGTSCLERINYWRQRACKEGWVECPPSGLPPMIECVGCHECANSQAEFDSHNGAHKSFKRCGDMVQGEGGGRNCAAVIDAFVSERKADANGVVRCQGHCGPIVAKGCQTFFWGKAQNSGFHTLNWRTCNTDKCQGYCANPFSNKCFKVPTSPPPPGSPPPPPPPSPPPPSPPPPPPPPGGKTTIKVTMSVVDSRWATTRNAVKVLASPSCTGGRTNVVAGNFRSKTQVRTVTFTCSNKVTSLQLYQDNNSKDGADLKVVVQAGGKSWTKSGWIKGIHGRKLTIDLK